MSQLSSIHDLPTWEDCESAVESGYATPLQAFIYNNEPADVGLEDAHTAAEFRQQLFAALVFERQSSNSS